jgi:addiction module HigA family antidote
MIKSLMNNRLNNRKRRPTHPGEMLREEFLPGYGLTQTELAQIIGVSRRTINELCQEWRGISADLAHRLARAFKTTPEVWLNLQTAVDLWDAMEAHKNEYQQITPLNQYRER